MEHFPRYWPCVRGIHRSPVNSPHKGQWRGALIFSLICAWINGWVYNREAGDLRRQCGHYDVTLMIFVTLSTVATAGAVASPVWYLHFVNAYWSLKHGWHFAVDIFKCILLTKMCRFDYNLTENFCGSNWKYVSIGLGNGLVPSGNKPLHEPILTKMNDVICRR